MTKCPKCNGDLNIQPSVAENYKLLYCWNTVSLKTKPSSKLCGYRGYMRDGVVVEEKEEVKSGQVKLGN